MKTVALLLGLLLLSYLAGALTRSERRRGLASEAGTEFLLLGIAVGPVGLGLVDREELVPFVPFLLAALGWLALASGTRYANLARADLHLRTIVVSVGTAGAAAGIQFAVAYQLAPAYLGIEGSEAFLLALGVAVIGADTAGNLATWSKLRSSATVQQVGSGEMARALSATAELVPLALLLAVFTASAGVHAVLLEPMTRGVISLALGCVLGLTASLLLTWAHEPYQWWSTLAGTVLLCVGISVQMGFSLLVAGFLVGLTVASWTRRGDELERIVTLSERPVLAPVWLMAGACIEPEPLVFVAPLAAVVLVTRWLVRLALATALTRRLAGSISVTLAISRCGWITTAAGLVVFQRHPGREGQAMLTIAVIVAIVCDLLSAAVSREPASRRVVDRADEVES